MDRWIDFKLALQVKRKPFTKAAIKKNVFANTVDAD